MRSVVGWRRLLILAFERPDFEGAYVWPVLKAIETGAISAESSQLTLAEMLQRPFMLGQTELARHDED